MKRRLFNILSALSLLMCVALGMLWIRSYWVGDMVIDFISDKNAPIDSFDGSPVEFGVNSEYGGLGCGEDLICSA